MNCPACDSNISKPATVKNGVQYHRCLTCGTIYSQQLDQVDMVGGSGELERAKNNPGIINRFVTLKGPRHIALDYGCGNGYLVRDLLDAGISARGYDPFNKLYNTFPSMTADIVSMIEVIEHMSRADMDAAMQQINGATVKGSMLYIETCFCEVCGPDSGYVNPEIGHSTIWSYNGLTETMKRHGWKPHARFNATTTTYIKE